MNVLVEIWEVVLVEEVFPATAQMGALLVSVVFEACLTLLDERRCQLDVNHENKNMLRTRGHTQA